MISDRLFMEMVSRSLPNINRTFFLAYDNTRGAMRPWLIWAASRQDATEAMGLYARWEAER